MHLGIGQMPGGIITIRNSKRRGDGIVTCPKTLPSAAGSKGSQGDGGSKDKRRNGEKENKQAGGNGTQCRALCRGGAPQSRPLCPL